jgi:uncharacterized damage-inducible protein DinB
VERIFSREFSWLCSMRNLHMVRSIGADSIIIREGEPMRKLTLLICLVATAAVAFSQEQSKTAAPLTQDNPFSTHNKFLYGGMKLILLRSAEKMPEENYSFKPTDVVRSYGQILGHVVDVQYSFCSVVLGEKDPNPNIEKTKTSKADLIAALKEVFTYCDRAYEGMTDASGAIMVRHLGMNTTKLALLNGNVLHMIEHYGNLVTYMRLKNIVPPTSEPGFLPQSPKK